MMSTRSFPLALIVLLMAFALPARAVAPHRPSPRREVSDTVEAEAYAFPLDRVKLLDGPFKKAQQRDAQYLLRLEPDRLLAWFRKRAGLQPKAKVYGGWEKDSIAGHSLGHYLSAASMKHAATGDVRLRERVAYIVDELAACQQAHGDGYLAAFPGGREGFKKLRNGEIEAEPFNLNGIWVPWYTLHKELAGLRDAYLYCDNEQALEVARELADWAHDVTSNLSAEQWQEMLKAEHGGMNEVLADLYGLTGEKKYLELAQKFYDRSVLDPLSRGEDILPGIHGNTQIPKLIGLSRLYELTGTEKYRDAAMFFWKTVVENHTYVNGGNTSGEYFGQPGRLAGRLKATTETCNTYNMLKLTRHLFALQPRARYMDYYERALYNHILASQHPETGMLVYKGYLEMPARKGFSTPFDSFWCCVGTGMENHARYGESIYFHTDRTLFWNLFVASELDWKEKGVTVRQQNEFPRKPWSRLAFTCEDPTNLTVKVRHPWWCRELTIRVNGEREKVSTEPTGYVSISRAWQTGDTVTVHMPMTLETEGMPDNERRIALRYGPIVLAAALEDDAPVPVLYGDEGAVTDGLVCADMEGLRFTSPSLAWAPGEDGKMTPRDLTLLPLYAITDQKYTVYMDRLPGTLDGLTTAARSEDLLPRQRRAAVRLLGSLDRAAGRAIPALEELRDETNEKEMNKAIDRALERLRERP